MVHGASAVVGWRKRRPVARDPWLGALLARRHVNVATVAFANKSAHCLGADGARQHLHYRPSARCLTGHTGAEVGDAAEVIEA